MNLFIVVAVMTACSSDRPGYSPDTPGASTPVVTLRVTPARDSGVVGDVKHFDADIRDAAGRVAGTTDGWRSSDPAIATVDSTGTVTTVGEGDVSITALWKNRSASSSLSVLPAPVSTVSLAPASSTLTIGQTVQLTVTLRAESGRILDRPLSWNSSNPSIASVAVGGLVTARAAGSATITVTSEGKIGTATVTVNAPAPVPVASVTITPGSATLTFGGTVQLSATTKDASGGTLTGRVITWSSGNTSIATVSASGLVTSVAAGNATITAASEGRTGQSTVTVNAPAPVPVASVTVTPGSATLTTGGTVQLSATTKDASGGMLTGRVITWSSGNTSIVTVSASGLVTSKAAGSATITATSEGRTGQSAIAVNAPAPVPVATVSVTPGTSSVTTGVTVQLNATTKDSTGATLTGRAITWSSGNTSIATVSTSGLVTTLAAGSATITAASGGKTGSATVTVTAPILPPPPGGGPPSGVAPILTEDFSSYGTTADLLGDPRKIYSVPEDELPSRISLVSPGYGASPHAMQFNYPDRTTDANRCGDYTIGRNLALPSVETEIWIDAYVKFSSGFLTRAPAAWGCTSGQALKLMFGRVNPTSRFQVIAGANGGQQWETGYPGNEEPNAGMVPTSTFSLTSLANNSWVRIRAHWKVGANGACELWINNTRVISMLNVNAAATQIYGIALGRNINQGPGTPQQLTWGLVQVYNRSPGW